MTAAEIIVRKWIIPSTVLCLQRAAMIPQTRRSEEAAGVNESSLYITGQLDESMLALCSFDMSKTAWKRADSVWMNWTQISESWIIIHPNENEGLSALMMHAGFWASQVFQCIVSEVGFICDEFWILTRTKFVSVFIKTWNLL